MTNQEQRDRLIKALTGLGGSAGNGRLCEILGWDEETYVKESAARHWG